VAATSLAQIVGVEQGVRSSVEQWWKLVREALRTQPLLVGIEKHYEPLEGNMPEPSDVQRVQINVEKMLEEARGKLGRYFDVTATKDWGNMGSGGARADVVLHGDVLLENAPATFLLYLEKRLAELHADLRKIPAQSPAEKWTPTTEPGLFRTEEIRSAKTKKTDHFEVVGLTKDHPGTVVKTSEDVIAGYTTTVKMTSAPTRERLDGILDRVASLREAVQLAIHEANRIDVTDVKVASRIFGYIFDDSVQVRS
jgi:hypothetical protein